MKLYHTSDRAIREPDVHYGRKNADFGQGFYLTPDREFTYRWAVADAVVNIYDLDETGLVVKRFERSREWFDYIFHNRRAQDTIEADVIIGPIANDTIFDTMGIISSGFLDPEEALDLLKIGPEYVQVAVKTKKAAGQLKWLSAERIESMDPSLKEKEQNEYLEAFAKAMEEKE